MALSPAQLQVLRHLASDDPALMHGHCSAWSTNQPTDVFSSLHVSGHIVQGPLRYGFTPFRYQLFTITPIGRAALANHT